MARKHYHVGMNTPGYLPEGDIATFTDRRSAESYAVDLKRSYLLDNNEPELATHYLAYGSAREGEIRLEDINNRHDLGTVIWIQDCTDTECSTDDTE